MTIAQGKNMLLNLLCGLIFGLGQVAHADDAPDVKHPVYPCLWEVSGKGLEKSSYLFGTCHSSDPRITTLHPEVQKAYDSADAVYGEIKYDAEAIAKVTDLVVRKDGKTVSEHVGEELTERANKFMKDINPELSLQAGLNHLNTWSAALELSKLKNKFQNGKVLDDILLEKAEAKGKHTEGLETIDGMLSTFNFMNYEQQIIFFETCLSFVEYEGELEKIEDVYIYQSPDVIGDYVKKHWNLKIDDREPTKEEAELKDLLFYKMLDKRNVAMAKKVSQKLQESPHQTHFVAVGAAHYSGETAIQGLLEKEGYTITPLYK